MEEIELDIIDELILESDSEIDTNLIENLILSEIPEETKL